MKTKKSFGKFILNVWAAVLRVLFPRYCVKCLTLKKRSDAWRYLPGKEKELKLIDKLELTSEDIAARVWSYETKLALLAGSNPAFNSALIGDINTEKELVAVWRKGVVKDIIAAMRVYTPSHTKMLQFLNCGRFDIPTWCRIATAVPAAFESLQPWEILGVEEKTPCYTEKDRWCLALALAEARPVWAPLFITELRNIPPQRLGQRGEELMRMFFAVAFKAKADISQLMPYLYVIFPELYLKVRADYTSYKNFAPFVEMMFPQVFKFLKPDDAKTSFSQIKFPAKVEDGEEAYVWLFIVYKMLGDKVVYQLMLKHLKALKEHVSKGLFNEMFGQMIDYAHDAGELKTLYAMCKAVDADSMLWATIQERIVNLAAVKENCVRFGFAFPFKGWEKEVAKRAVVLMAQQKQLAGFVNRLTELPYGLEQVALETMEIQSQLDALDSTNLEKMVTTMKLYPEAEKKFFCMDSNLCEQQNSLKELKLGYIRQHQPDDATFSALLSYTCMLSYDSRKVLIVAYAEKWGLRKWQYQLAMQSHFSAEAPLWKQYVREE